MSTDAVSVTASSSVVSALQKASAATGTNFDYLLKTAMRESGMKPAAKSASSSATGLFQFVEQTWLGMVKNSGEKYGLGSYAAAITKGSDGRFHTDNAADRQAILDLRSDPQVSALMAGEYTAQCKSKMQSSLGRTVGDGELYAAHFLGPDAATRLIKLNETSPGTSAAAAFPQAADANRSVFYNADGSARSVSEVYAWASRQTQNVVHVAQAQAPTQTSATAQAGVAAMLAQFQTRMLAAALLSEPASQNDTQAANGTETTGENRTASPLQLSYGVLDVLSAMQPSQTQRS